METLMDEEITLAEQLYSEAIAQGAKGAIEGISNPSAAIPFTRREVELLRQALDLGLPLEKQISSHVMIGIDLFDIGKWTNEIEAGRICEIGLEANPLAFSSLSEIQTGIKMDSQSAQGMLSRDTHFGIM